MSTDQIILLLIRFFFFWYTSQEGKGFWERDFGKKFTQTPQSHITYIIIVYERRKMPIHMQWIEPAQ